MRVASISEIEQEFQARVNKMVLCSFATLDAHNRVRSRILHPLWEGMTGWICTRRGTPKAKHLAHHPYVSLAYIADIEKPVYVDCVAGWEDDADTKRRIWELFRTTPPPVGYDPTPVFGSPDHPNFGLLKVTPWRINLSDQKSKTPYVIWEKSEESE
jgi:general stress protein 26